MLKDAKVSIIVPIYNTVLFLQECVESVQNQTYKNIEILLVDDGSTDGSEKICDQLQSCDKRIRVFHKHNGGNTSARLLGLNMATGDYICFVDSDDWVDDYMVEAMVTEMHNSDSDVILCGHYREYSNKTIKILDLLGPQIFSGPDEMRFVYSKMIFCKEFENGGVTRSLWSKLFKRNMLLEVFEDIDPKMQFGEDAACVFSYLLLSNAICITDVAPYHYRMRSDSITHKKDKHYLEKINALNEHLMKKFKTCIWEDILIKQLNYFIMHLCILTSEYLEGMDYGISIPKYAFQMPNYILNKKILLYGAGDVGISYHKYLISINACEIVAWSDKYVNEIEGFPLTGISEIKTVVCDWVIVAVGNENTAEEVKKELATAGIQKEKLLWIRPVTFVSLFARE